MEDVPCYTARRFSKYIEDEGIKILKWPTQSLDLNPIDNPWKIIYGRSWPKNHLQLLNYGTN